MSYIEFYGLEVEPFSNSVASGKFFYNSTQHSQAIARLAYAVESRKGLALVVGDTGSGKTTLARRMLDQLSEDEYYAALLVIIHSAVTADWLLRRIAILLEINDPPHEKLALHGLIYERLIQLFEEGKKTVILLDEAQMLQNREIMEAFKGLLNMEAQEKKLLTFLFFGLSELEDHLQVDGPLNQRVAVRCRLKPLSAESADHYIKHRLRAAGAGRMLFSKEAVESICRLSRGIPRLINTLCDNALFEGYLLEKDLINRSIIAKVGKDLCLDSDCGNEPEETAAKPAQSIEQAEDSEKIDHLLDKLTV